jgi:hypothetical protein
LNRQAEQARPNNDENEDDEDDEDDGDENEEEEGDDLNEASRANSQAAELAAEEARRAARQAATAGDSCRSCQVGDKHYLPNTDFNIRQGPCHVRQCKCLCNGTHDCPNERIRNLCTMRDRGLRQDVSIKLFL